MPKPDEIVKILSNSRDYTFNHLWEVMPNFRCPIVGTCLSVPEQKKIIKKTAGQTKRMSAFDIHHLLMEYMNTENPVSLKTERYIRSKYKTAIERYGALSESELAGLWGDAGETGEMAGLFYIIATRSDISTGLRMTAFGEIHMIGHSNLHDIIKARKELTQQQEVNERLTGRLAEEKEKTVQLNRINKDNRKEIRALNVQISTLTKPRKNPAGLTEDTAPLKERVAELEAQLAETRHENNRLLREKRKLEIRYFETESTAELLKGELLELTRAVSVENESSCCPDNCCHACIKCPKRVLMIGGMTKMKPFYKNIVESGGNEFIYHDGYMKNKTRQLNDLVSRSDLILCPTNCNSHNACLRIKRLCKKYNKPFRMMPCSSLNAVSKAMTPDTNQGINA